MACLWGQRRPRVEQRNPPADGRLPELPHPILILITPNWSKGSASRRFIKIEGPFIKFLMLALCAKFVPDKQTPVGGPRTTAIEFLVSVPSCDELPFLFTSVKQKGDGRGGAPPLSCWHPCRKPWLLFQHILQFREIPEDAV